MHTLIDAASGLFLSWDGNPKPPVDTFTAEAHDVTLTYVSGHLVSVIGNDIDVARLVVIDRKARQLARGEFHTEPAMSHTSRGTQYTPEFLDRVAAAYARGSYAAVQEEFDVSRRQAARYIARARDAGVIE